MDEDRKKQVMIGVIVVCLVATVIVVVAGRMGGGAKALNDPIQMLCTNPDCGRTFEISREQYINWRKQIGQTMIPMIEMPGFKCPYCGQDSAYMDM